MTSAEVIDVDEFLEDPSACSGALARPCIPGSEITQIADMTEALSEGLVSGEIDGEHHISAWTCGDGACALHAVFGTCSGGELYAPDIRNVILSELPVDLLELRQRLPSQASRELLQKLLQNVWREVKDAGSVLHNGNEPDVEAGMLWTACSSDMQNDFLGFWSLRRMEMEKETVLRAALQSFARTLFQPCNEESIVRPLCVHLDYLLPTAPENLHLRDSAHSEALILFEGSRGSLNLLHPCPERPSMTKFQALFAPEPEFDRYREVFS